LAEPHNRLEEIVSRLRTQGYRLTPQRMAVLRVLIGNQEHLSIDQIYERVKVDFPMTSLATVYKTLAVLKEMGEVLELGFGSDSNRYDSNLHPHAHLTCVKCKKIIDVDIDIGRIVPEELTQEIARRTGYQMVSCRLDFFGICPQCQRELN